MAPQERFDWWAAQPAGRTAVRPTPPQPAATRRVARPRAAEPKATELPAAEPSAAESHSVDAAEVYRAVQASAAFQEIRRGYRGFVVPATAVFLGWYLLYLGAQAAAPGLMRLQVAGPLNVAWLLGLLQFASTFLLTWLYARNARTKRDRAALDLRWDTQDQLR